MTVNIEWMRSDMRGENRRFLISIVVAAAAPAGGGAAIGNDLARNPAPLPPTPPQAMILQPPPAVAIKP